MAISDIERTQKISKTDNLDELFEIEKDKFTKYIGMHYPKMESNVFEQEKALFMLKIAEIENQLSMMKDQNGQPKSLKTNGLYSDETKISICTAFITMAMLGRTLLNNENYLVPYGKKIVFQEGYMGSFQKMMAHPEVESFNNEPIVVFEGDEFEYQTFPTVQILNHKRNTSEIPYESRNVKVYNKNKELKIPKVRAVFWILLLNNDRQRHYVIESDIINDIRDKAVKNEGMGNFWGGGINSYLEMCKKTLINRVYNKYFPKNSYDKTLLLKQTGGVDLENLDYEEAEVIESTSLEPQVIAPVESPKETSLDYVRKMAEVTDKVTGQIYNQYLLNKPDMSEDDAKAIITVVNGLKTKTQAEEKLKELQSIMPQKQEEESPI